MNIKLPLLPINDHWLAINQVSQKFYIRIKWSRGTVVPGKVSGRAPRKGLRAIASNWEWLLEIIETELENGTSL